jgi:hypothetical protein
MIDRMPDDYHPLMPRRNPEDIDLGAIKTDLEFLIERVERLRREQALKPLYTMIGERRDRHRLDRTLLAALPLNYADLLEPHSYRFAIRHRFQCHAVT